MDLLAYYGLSADDQATDGSAADSLVDDDGLLGQVAEDSGDVEQQSASGVAAAASSPSAAAPAAIRVSASLRDGDPYNIDGKDFDPELFLQRELRSKGVHQLVDLNNEVSFAKRTLDNEIKLLVYENYSKFIKATDMIKDMKDNVESMENDMMSVEHQMEVIRSTAVNLEQSFAPNRGKVDNLVGVSRLLNRLEFLFELPGRLRRCIAVGADAQAVRYYRTASKILQRYQSVKSFERIRTESESIANGLRQVLRARVQDAENLSAADQIEVASMLIDLQEPEEQLLVDIFAARRQRLLAELDVTRQRLAAEPEMAPDRAMGVLHVGYVESLVLFAGSFMEGFVRSRHGSSPTNARGTSGSSSAATGSASSSSSAASASASAAGTESSGSVATRCHGALVRFVEELLEPYLAEARLCLGRLALRQYPLDAVEHNVKGSGGGGGDAGAAGVGSAANNGSSSGSSSEAAVAPTTAQGQDEASQAPQQQAQQPASSVTPDESTDWSARVARGVQLSVAGLEAFHESLRAVFASLQDPLTTPADRPAIQGALLAIQARAGAEMQRALERAALQVFLHAEAAQAAVVARVCEAAAKASSVNPKENANANGNAVGDAAASPHLPKPAEVAAELLAVAGRAVELLGPLVRFQQQRAAEYTRPASAGAVSSGGGSSNRGGGLGSGGESDLLSTFAGRMLQSWGSVLLFHCHSQGHRTHGRRGPSLGIGQPHHRCHFLRPSRAPIFAAGPQSALVVQHTPGRADPAVDLLPEVPADAFLHAPPGHSHHHSHSFSVGGTAAAGFESGGNSPASASSSSLLSSSGNGKATLFQSPSSFGKRSSASAAAAAAAGGDEEHKQQHQQQQQGDSVALQPMERLAQLVETAPPIAFLVLSRVASEMARTQIDSFLGVLSSQAESAVAPTLHKTRIPAAIALASEASQLLLRAYVERHAARLSGVLRRSWPHITAMLASPSNVSEPVMEFWRLLQAGPGQELQAFMPAASPVGYRVAASARGASHAGGAVGGGYGRLESDIGNLFKQRIAVFDEVPAGSRHAALAAVLKIVFKEFLETLRPRRLDQWALLQLQIDTLMHRQFVLHLFSESDSEVLIQLLDDILATALGRCTVAPSPNNVGIAETVCTKYINHLPFV